MQGPIATYRYSKRKLLIFYSIMLIIAFCTVYFDDPRDLATICLWWVLCMVLCGIHFSIYAYGMRFELYEETFHWVFFGIPFQLVRNRMRFSYGPFMGWFNLEEKVTRGLPRLNHRISCFYWLLETPIDTKTLIKEPVITDATQPAPNT